MGFKCFDNSVFYRHNTLDRNNPQGRNKAMKTEEKPFNTDPFFKEMLLRTAIKELEKENSALRVEKGQLLSEIQYLEDKLGIKKEKRVERKKRTKPPFPKKMSREDFDKRQARDYELVEIAKNKPVIKLNIKP